MLGYIILGIVVLLILVVLIRTLTFKPIKEDRERTEVTVDREKAVTNLQQLIRCKTVSRYDKVAIPEDDKEFRKLLDLLPELYPNVFKTCEYTEFTERQILFRWKGQDSTLEPPVFMAHFDVVPVDESGWVKPAFDAIIEDGILWGRGSLDTKISFNGILSAADELISKGFVPKSDMYFAFSGQEEVNGPEADNMVTWFADKGITPKFVLDEGGAVASDVFPGVKEPCGLIGLAEKGMMNLVYTVESDGGHASAPKPHTPVGVLSTACAKMEAHPFMMKMSEPVKMMFDTLGRYSTFTYRMIFSNLWLFSGVLDILGKKSGGTINSLFRTTVAFTQMEGSDAPNVIPPKASMVSNIRLNPGDTIESALSYIKNTINDDRVKITVFDAENPSKIADTNTEAWTIIKNAVSDTWQGCIVAPYLMVQCSDSRYYDRISDRVFKFSAFDITSELLETIHGHNERVKVSTVGNAVEFFTRIMMEC